MNNKKTSVFLLSVSLLLSGCGRITIEDVGRAESEIEKNQSEIIENLNDTQKLETKMSDDFSKSIQGKKIKTLSKQNSLVKKNMEERRKHIKAIEDQQDSLKKQLKVLESFEDEKINQELKTNYIKELSHLNKQLNKYRKHYEKNIKLQEVYFKDISSKDATPENFVDGLEKINTDYKKLQEKLTKIDQQLQDIAVLQVDFKNEVKKSLEKGSK